MEMIKIDPKSHTEVSRFFQGYAWNYVPDAILEGTMGEVYVDDEDRPQIVVLAVPNLELNIISGDAKKPAVRKFLEELPAPKILILACGGLEESLREMHPGRLIYLERYAFTSEKLDVQYLNDLKSELADGYRLRKIDLEIALQLAAEDSEFAAEHMLNFDSPQDFIHRGFGYCILREDEIVSVATTFAICKKGIEIQINTRKEYQGRGLATVVAAQLVIHSLENNLDPNWDAANKPSVGLAKKLGYTPAGTYSMIVLARSRWRAVLGAAIFKIQGLLQN
jgi:RimJ/RimL family protein N-acetyltransferase